MKLSLKGKNGVTEKWVNNNTICHGKVNGVKGSRNLNCLDWQVTEKLQTLLKMHQKLQGGKWKVADYQKCTTGKWNKNKQHKCCFK